jgi:hypothetical protein
VHHKPDQQTKRVGDDMALAPVDPFSCVIASNPATFCGFYALAIDNSGARLGVAPVGQPCGFDQLAVRDRPVSPLWRSSRVTCYAAWAA